VRAATDALWAALRDAMRHRGLPAPEALARDAAHWTDPNLALSQTCGMPFRLGLHARVTLLGPFDFGLEGCAASSGWSRRPISAADRARSRG
jgi:hypothetical protein